MSTHEADHQTLIDTMVECVHVTPIEASRILEAHDWNLEDALNTCLAVDSHLTPPSNTNSNPNTSSTNDNDNSSSSSSNNNSTRANPENKTAAPTSMSSSSSTSPNTATSSPSSSPSQSGWFVSASGNPSYLYVYLIA